jgi:hypothetical protein
MDMTMALELKGTICMGGQSGLVWGGFDYQRTFKFLQQNSALFGRIVPMHTADVSKLTVAYCMPCWTESKVTTFICLLAYG